MPIIGNRIPIPIPPSCLDAIPPARWGEGYKGHKILAYPYPLPLPLPEEHSLVTRWNVTSR
eukprot:scaffold105433_cov31-Tisochrysis_lutea.AAC.2